MRMLFLIAVLVSTVLSLTMAASNCSVCELQDSYIESNGYGCFQLNNGQVACTCPDRRYKLDAPCRICKRENICGNDPKSFCAEVSPKSLGTSSNKTQYYACFCADLSFNVEAPCPSIPVATTVQPSKVE